MQGLFIIDFDLTIPTQHTHNILFQAKLRGLLRDDDIDALWQLVKDVPATGSEARWREVLMALIDEGHAVAIASFNEYPQVIQRYLQEKIQLPKKYLEQIFIESWLPQNPMVSSKNQHIENVMRHFNYANDEGVILIDDARFNCEAAKAAGWQAIETEAGDRSGKHLEEMMAAATRLASD